MIISGSAWISIYRKVWRHHEDNNGKERADADGIVQPVRGTVLFGGVLPVETSR